MNIRTKAVRWLTLAIATGALANLAHGTETFTAYDLSIDFTNSTASYWSINGAPQTTGTTFLEIAPMGRSTSIQTDNAGKITGTGMLKVTYNADGVPFSVFSVTYAGQIGAAAGALPTATLYIKGSGYTADGTGGPTTTLNSISLKFVGQPGINPLNSNQVRIVGQLTGAIRGKTPLGTLAATLPTLPAVIPSSSSNLVSITTSVAQNEKRMLLFDNGYAGVGAVGSSSNFVFNTVGNGPSRGAVFIVSGAVGPCTNQNGQSTLTFSAPVSAQFKGKVKGQVVWGTADPSQIDPALVR